jgi:uncharacterized cupin superfamily protein
MLYSRLRPGDGPKKFSPAEGTEEIIFVIKGNIRVKYGKMDFLIGPGEAFHSKECAAFHMENIGSDDAVFISAGGRGGTRTGKPVEKESAPDEAEEVKETEAAEEEQEFIITREDELNSYTHPHFVRALLYKKPSFFTSNQNQGRL